VDAQDHGQSAEPDQHLPLAVAKAVCKRSKHE
jgi:hypothetical protein